MILLALVQSWKRKSEGPGPVDTTPRQTAVWPYGFDANIQVQKVRTFVDEGARNPFR